MKSIAVILLLACPLCFATSIEYREIARLKARQAQLEFVLAEVRAFYRDDHTFIAAFDSAQKKWEEYCAAMLKARFPAKRKQEEYGSVYELAYATVKSGLIEARIKDISLWVDGAEEGDVSKGSVKLKKELDEIRKPRKAEPVGMRRRERSASP